jgi:hypothetical protein
LPTRSAAADSKKTRPRKRILILLAAVAAFIGFVFYSLERVEPLKVIDSRMERQGDRVFVEGTIRNTGPDLPGVELEVSYYDERGAKLASDKLTVSGLREGADVTFKTPVRQLAGAGSFSIYFNRGRNPYGN